MKTIFWVLLSLSFVLIDCSEQQEKSTQNNKTNLPIEVPRTVVAKSALNYNHELSIWILNGTPYSGFAVSYYPDSSLMEKFGILSGKKQNKAIQWYPDGQIKSVSHYHKGKLHGVKKTWSTDSTHMLIAHFNYHRGRAHGEQKKWYKTGELFKRLNLNMGKEEGLQQAFRKNGALYANYEVREGRIFGLKKAALCFGLEEEKIKRKRIREMNNPVHTQ